MQKSQLFTWTGTKSNFFFLRRVCHSECNAGGNGHKMRTCYVTLNRIFFSTPFPFPFAFVFLSSFPPPRLSLQDFGLQENPSGGGEAGGRGRGDQTCHHRPQGGSNLLHFPWYPLTRACVILSACLQCPGCLSADSENLFDLFSFFSYSLWSQPPTNSFIQMFSLSFSFPPLPSSPLSSPVLPCSSGSS